MLQINNTDNYARIQEKFQYIYTVCST